MSSRREDLDVTDRAIAEFGETKFNSTPTIVFLGLGLVLIVLERGASAGAWDSRPNYHPAMLAKVMIRQTSARIMLLFGSGLLRDSTGEDRW